MKISKILTEAFIDNLPLKKFDKHILNKIHEESISETDIEDLTLFLQNLSTEFAIDLDKVVKLYMTYKKYKDILFSEEGIEIVEEYDTLSPGIYDLTKFAILSYMEKHYENKEVFNNEGIGAEVYLMETIDFMISEEMWPELQISMPVDERYYGPNDSGDDMTPPADGTFYGSVYLSMLPYVENGSPKPSIGFDFLNFNEEAFGDWLIEVKGRKFSDVIDSGRIKTSYFKYPKNLTEEEIKLCCDRWVEVCLRILKRNIPLLLEYKDYVEHEGGIFENYNRNKNNLK